MHNILAVIVRPYTFESRNHKSPPNFSKWLAIFYAVNIYLTDGTMNATLS